MLWINSCEVNLILVIIKGMPPAELESYIKEQLAKGLEPFVIRQTLMSSGWGVEAIDESFQKIEMDRYEAEHRTAQPVQQPSVVANPAPWEQSTRDSVPMTPSGVGMPSTMIQPVAVSPANSVYGVGNQQRRSRKALWIGISVLLLLLLVGGGAWGYFKVWMGSEMVMQRMAQNMSQLKSAQYQGELKVRAKVQGPVSISQLPGQTGKVLGTAFPAMDALQGTPEFGATLSLSGMFDVNDPKAPKSETSATLSLEGEAGRLLVGKNVFGIDLKTVEKTVMFVRFRDLPELGMFDLSTFVNQWIKVDFKELEKQYGWKVQQLDQELTTEQEQKAQEILAESKVIIVTQQLANQEVDGHDSLHYLFEIDKEQLVEMLVRMSSIQGELVSETEVNRLREGLKDVVLPKGEMWIDSSSWYLRRLMLTTSLDDDSGEYEGTVTFDVKLDKFNEPAVIELPSEFMTVDEVQKKFQESSAMMLQQQMGGVNDAKRKSDLMALAMAIHMYAVDQNGNFPRGIPVGAENKIMLGTGDGYLNLSTVLVPTYIAEMPKDPLIGSDEMTMYFIHRTTGGRVVLTAMGDTGEEIVEER